MSKEKSAGFDRMSKLADSEDVFEDTFTLKKGKKKGKEEKQKKE